MPVTSFGTGSKNLDKILQGGFPGGVLSVVMGETGTGRTTLALAVSAVAARRDLKTMYFDCEGSISADRLGTLGLGADHFNSVNPTTLEQCLAAALRAVTSDGCGLVILDSPNMLPTDRRNVSIAGMFTNWVPKIGTALAARPQVALLMTWQLRRVGTREEMKSANFGTPTALAHGSAVSLRLEPHEDGVEATVTKDRFGLVGENPSCILKFTDKWMIKDLRMGHVPINRKKIPTRFDREDPL
jgi:predicted ATP-dependent serine protease